MACRLYLWYSVQDAVCKSLRVAAEKNAVSQACN